MKHALPVVIGVLLLFPASATAQSSADAYLGLLSLPLKACGNTDKEKSAYVDKMSGIADRIAKELRGRQADSEARVERDKKAIVSQVGSQAGLTSAEIDKIAAGGDLSEQESEAIANRILKEQYGISLDEARRLGKMDSKGREEWAKAYSDEAAADAQAKAGSTRAAPQKAGPAESASKVLAVTQQRDALMKKVSAPAARARQEIGKLEQDPALKQMRRDIDNLWGDFGTRCMGLGTSDCPALESKLKAMRTQYCGRYSPKFYAILQQWRSGLSAAMPDFAQFDKAQAEVEKAQMGVSQPITVPGSAALSAVDELASVLMNEAFKYDIVEDSAR